MLHRPSDIVCLCEMLGRAASIIDLVHKKLFAESGAHENPEGASNAAASQWAGWQLGRWQCAGEGSTSC